MILVVGATGNLGGAIAHKLLEQGNKVRIAVREGSNYSSLVDMGAQPVFADLKEPDTLRAACDGIELVVTTANAVIPRKPDDSTESVDLNGNKNLIDAARAEGVDRFVFTSALGASPEHFVPFLQAKGQAEAHLRESGIDWTILEPNLFMDVWLPSMIGPALAGQPVTLVGEAKRQHSMVAMRDVVDYAVAACTTDDARNQMLVIGGPQPVTWWDVVAAFEQALGRDIAVETVPFGTPIPGFPESMNGVVQGLEMYDSPIDMTELSATYKVVPTALADWVREFVGSA